MTLKKYASANNPKHFTAFTVVVVLLSIQSALTSVTARDEVRAGGEEAGRAARAIA